MKFRILTKPLRPTAEGAMIYFKNTWGINNFKIEQPIVVDSFKPTFHANTTDFHILCVEVSESPYYSALDAFVIFCRNRNLPVKLYVAYPSESLDTENYRSLKLAKERGVGALEVDENGNGSVLLEALSLSLTGLSPGDLRKFPRKYREQVSAAENSFKNGEPSKACGKIYDEIEELSRELAKKTHSKGFWKSGINPKQKFSGPWGPLLKTFMDELNNKLCPGLPHMLLARVYAIVPYRNDSGHKPSSRKRLIERDRQLRTRFEHARDILLDLIEAKKKSKL